MQIKHLSLASLSIALLSLTACTNDDETPTPEPFNYTVPETYTFTRSNATTVDYVGQTTRINMFDEMRTYIRSAATNGTIVDNTILSEMYNNTNSRFAGVGLNESGRQLKDKTAASKDYFSLFNGQGTVTEQVNVRNFFENQFLDTKVASQGGRFEKGSRQ